MAKAKLASYLTEVSGHLGNFVYYNSYGREYIRVYTKPENPDTAKQKIVRKTFGDAVRSWQSLPSEQHQKYNKKARRLSLSGYNLYISIYMKDNLSHEDLKINSKALSTAFNRHSDSIQIAGCSVASPFCLNDRPLSPYIQVSPAL